VAIVWLGHSTFKRKLGSRKPDDHVDEHAHEWLQALFIDRLGDDVERHGLFALHQVPDTEVGSGHISGNLPIAVINATIGNYRDQQINGTISCSFTAIDR
jgi:hypothetical protein